MCTCRGHRTALGPLLSFSAYVLGLSAGHRAGTASVSSQDSISLLLFPFSVRRSYCSTGWPQSAHPPASAFGALGPNFATLTPGVSRFWVQSLALKLNETLTPDLPVWEPLVFVSLK